MINIIKKHKRKLFRRVILESEPDARAYMNKLSIYLIKCGKLYYEGAPIIGDKDYDLLYRMLEDYEDVYPQHILKESPTQTVGTDINKVENPK